MNTDTDIIATTLRYAGTKLPLADQALLKEAVKCLDRVDGCIADLEALRLILGQDTINDLLRGSEPGQNKLMAMKGLGGLYENKNSDR